MESRETVPDNKPSGSIASSLQCEEELRQDVMILPLIGGVNGPEARNRDELPKREREL
jgi:hypothetical protein